MRELFTEITIEASTDIVYRALIDVERYSEWNPFIVFAKGKVALASSAQGQRSMPLGIAPVCRMGRVGFDSDCASGSAAWERPFTLIGREK